MPKSASKNTISSSGLASVDELEPLPLPSNLMETVPSDPKWVEVIVTGQNPPGHDYSSRSELVFATAVWLLSRGVQPGHVLSILTAPDLGISAHVRESPNYLKYAQRQVMRAMAIVEASAGGWPVLNEKLQPVPSHPKNVRHALACQGVDAQRNLFTKVDEFNGAGLDGRDLNDIADILCSQFHRDLDFVAVPTAIKRELLAIAHENHYHPVIDYLDGQVWDGTPRIDTWLTDYCDADDSDLNREFGSKLLIAGVRRIKQPGVKFDTMLVLEGAQGAGKSRVAQLLAVRPEWFCGSLNLTSDDKTKAELLARAWIVECQELDGLNKATSQSLKRFLSTAIDMFRRAYGRDAGEYRRHCIILGTTNEGAYLRDLTGNRRIWPVVVKQIDLARFSADVDQLWAEAVVREATGESITLSPHLWPAAANAQGQRMVEDAYADVLEDSFAELTGRVSMDSIKLLLGVDTARMSPTDTRRIKAVMAGLGWEYGTHRLHDLGRIDKIQRKGFARGDVDECKVEYIARRIDGGIVVIHRFDERHGEEPPF
ncbi:VapE domain-containing protein [Neotabrizicola sp. VNH66]|uniref:VapE domain-containing protein n=1 Tax=Neotabrizicola sp. VNH66 TaxID=3400918 RepID=UPI003C05B608